METSELADIEIKADEDSMEDGFASLWNIATTSTGGDTSNARYLASKLLGFLCKQRCGFLVVSSTDAKYLDEWFERDNTLLYDWTPESEKVDVLAQHVHAPFEALSIYLKEKKFKATTKYSPRRDIRVAWFTEDWNVG